MTQQIDNEKRLLDGVFTDETTEELSRISLAKGLRALGRRRRNRIITRAFLVASVLAGFVSLLVERGDVTSPISPHNGSGPLAQRPTPGALPDRMEQISDRELLALFPNETLALVGAPGQQRLLVLNKIRPEHSAIQ